MRKDLVPLLRCPETHQPLTLDSRAETPAEVRSGSLATADGARVYPIIDGVAELIPHSQLDRDTQTERAVRDEKRRDWAVEVQRPYLNDAPGSPWIWPAFAAAVEQGLAQIDLRGRFALDVGCATAWSTRMICERGAQAVALDISTGILRDAEAQFASGVFFDRVAATMTALPFVDATFDLVFASATIHHSDALETAFGEFARVLKRGGKAILVNEPVQGILRSADSFGAEDKAAGMNEHIYRLRDYRSAAARAGFETRVLFPADLEKQMRGEHPLPPSAPLRALRSVWGVAGRFKPLLLPIGHWLIGLTLVMVAEKR
jgi:SAM-dependent methyltransferase